jgi:enediyne polyketide synthase
VPEGTLLPIGVGRVHPGGPRLHSAVEGHPAGQLRYCAVERSRDGDTYVYDVVVRDEAGEVLERWDGLVLRAVRKKDGRGPWVPSLLGSYVERSLDDLVAGGTDAGVSVAVEPHAGGEPLGVPERRALTKVAVGRALGHGADVRYRPDGRPETDGAAVSASHGGGVTLAVAATGSVGCDVEPVAARTPEVWAGLLGRNEPLAGLVARETGEDYDTAATRVWSAAESLLKAGIADAPLSVTPVRRDAWMLFSSGELRIATLATTLRGGEAPIVLAVLTEGS